MTNEDGVGVLGTHRGQERGHLIAQLATLGHVERFEGSETREHLRVAADDLEHVLIPHEQDRDVGRVGEIEEPLERVV